MIKKDDMKDSGWSDGGIVVFLRLNIMVLVAYWGISHLNWILFKSVGVQPMPIWPAAAIAIVTLIVFGWRIAFGIALGSIFSNHFSLGGSWTFASLIAVMNTLAPLLGAVLIKHKISGRLWSSWNRIDIIVMFLIGVVLVPLLTATGGIGSKYLLGLISFVDMPQALMRWSLANALGTLLFAPPLLFWFFKGDKNK